MKTVIAMSGGVDSSVAAAMLKEQGCEVIGVTMQIWPSEKSARAADKFGGCCGISAVEDARRVAYQLGIKHYVMNFRDIFARDVIADFCREYSLGRTPNPCIRCNQYIKFDALWQKAAGLGADCIATGHYARIEKDAATGRYMLKKGVDSRKDQSYVLYPLTRHQLEHTLFPVGNLTKEKVREIADGLKLPVAHKPESQEICFIPDNNYGRFVMEHFPEVARPGPILNRDGAVLGEHKGIVFYTVGQRKRLGICASKPYYVVAIDALRNAIIVGGKEELFTDELVASDVNWIAGAEPEKAISLKAKIRYLHREAEAVVSPCPDNSARVKFTSPQMAVTPGQAVVFYEEDTVAGGGIIAG